MFRRIDADGEKNLSLSFEGQYLSAIKGESVAAALLAAGFGTFRKTPGTGTPRGPYCMMGACFDCLVEIDGEVVQACATPAREGMVVRMPAGPGRPAEGADG